MTEKNTQVKMISASLSADVQDGIRSSLFRFLSHVDQSSFDFSRCVVFPGFCDVHVHFREPGFFYKETVASGSLASARGGYTAVCTMPNLNPVPDSVKHLKIQKDIIEKSACVHVYPYGAITVGELGKEIADLEGMAEGVVGFSDDGRGV